jgi:hypothetical protein
MRSTSAFDVDEHWQGEAELGEPSPTPRLLQRRCNGQDGLDGRAATRPIARCSQRHQASNPSGGLHMTDRQTIERQTITDDGLEKREIVEEDYVPGAPDGGDERQAGGAVVGGLGGAVVGGVVGGPVGAVIGGAIGAASGATAGLVDETNDNDNVDEIVVQREERRG